MTKFDIVVVGAGPGGAMAARHAALKGASVLLVERRRFIGSERRRKRRDRRLPDMAAQCPLMLSEQELHPSDQ